jgi:predicted nucleic acid-binding protein
MAAKPLFIDSGGFYALVSPDSASHERAIEIMQTAAQKRRRAVTTDYIIDETATLLRARGLAKLLAEFFRLTEESRALTIEWTSPDQRNSA